MDYSPFVHFILQNVNKQMTMSITVKLYNLVKYITPPPPPFINCIPYYLLQINATVQRPNFSSDVLFVLS